MEITKFGDVKVNGDADQVLRAVAGNAAQEGKFFNPAEWLVLRGGAYCIKKSEVISYEITTGDTYQVVELRCSGGVKITLLEADAADFMTILRAETGATYPTPGLE